MSFPFKDIENCIVTNIYGKKNPIYTSGKHDGIDLVCSGNKTIISVSDGIVIRSGTNKSWGNFVVVQMKDKRAIVYAHLNTIYAKINSSIKSGDNIGIMGNTGNSTGAHLHIEIQKKYYKAGSTDDIAKFLNIENKNGKVKIIKEEIKLANIEPWKLEVCEKFLEEKKLDKKYWMDRIKKSIDLADMIVILDAVTKE